MDPIPPFIRKYLTRMQRLDAPRAPTRGRRKPPEAGIAVPALPPKGPLPLEGGAEAPLDFSE